MNTTKIASFSAPAPLIDQVSDIARTEDRPFSSVIRAALRDYLANRAKTEVAA